MRRTAQPTWPIGHGGWLFAGRAAFEGGAASFLAEGARRGERVLFVAEDPVARRWPGELVADGILVLASLDDVYGPLRDGDLGRQQVAIAGALAEAHRDGFVGLRIVADNTSMALDDLERWLAWEEVADALMAERPVTGLCAFDRDRLAGAAIEVLTARHPRLATPA